MFLPIRGGVLFLPIRRGPFLPIRRGLVFANPKSYYFCQFGGSYFANPAGYVFCQYGGYYFGQNLSGNKKVNSKRYQVVRIQARNQ